jgi:hypothetical protein
MNLQNKIPEFHRLFSIAQSHRDGCLKCPSSLFPCRICRHCEHPQRPIVVWLMDTSKQAISSGIAHAAGIIVAICVHKGRGAVDGSECAWYFIVFSIDTTLGVFVALRLHRCAMAMAALQVDSRVLPSAASEHEHSSLLPASQEGAAVAGSILRDILTCGEYGNPPCIRTWVLQV